MEIDVIKFNNNYAALAALLGRNPKSIYVADLRTQTAATESGVRLVNGQTIPSAGLTVATPNPLYVKGHFNAYSAHLGTTNTTKAIPASLVADAITILSGNWNDGNSGSTLGSRTASDTTINAAVLTGIVPTGNGYYSGGAENSIRLLEDWSNKTLTFNGSTVVLFYSQFATAPWGASQDVYNPPIRNWSFDRNFIDPAKLPLGTPELRTLFRGEVTTLQANATQ